MPKNSSPSKPGLTPVGSRTALLALLTAALWGGNPVAVSFSVEALPPIAVAGVRFALATGFMLIWCRFEGSSLRLAAGQLRLVLLAGLGLFLQIASFNVGTALSNSSHSSMMINTFIFWVAVLEHFVTKTDRLTRQKLLGLTLATAGVMLILSVRPAGAASTNSLDAPTLGGDLILLLSALLLGAKVVFMKHALRTVEPGKLVFWHDVVGVVLFFVCSLAFERPISVGWTVPAGVAILYQGILVAGLCFALQAYLLRRHSASQIAAFSFAAPIFGVLLAVLLRGDPLSPWLFVSTLCVAGGIFMVQLRPRAVTVPRSKGGVA